MRNESVSWQKLGRGRRKKTGALTERKKFALRSKHQYDQIRKLKEANRMLRTHTSPQEIGLADEGVLTKRLQREFPDDRIEHVGKGGDILQFVVYRAKDAGCIVYECKRTPRISSKHVDQTALAKKKHVKRTTQFWLQPVRGRGSRASMRTQESLSSFLLPS